MASASAAITYPDLEKRFIAWTKSSSNVAGLICYGSRSTSERVVDSYSDLDLMVFSMNPEVYRSDEWLNGFGDIWISALDFTGAGDREWFIIFEGGLKVDVVFTKANHGFQLKEQMDFSPYGELIEQGFRVLFEAESLPRTNTEVGQQERLTALSPPLTINLVLIRVFKAVTLYRRGDFARAKTMLIEGAIRQLAKILDSYKKSASLNSLDSQDLYKKKLDLLLEQSASLERIDRDADPAYLRDSLLTSLSLISDIGSLRSDWQYDPFPTKGQAEVMRWLHRELGNVNR